MQKQEIETLLVRTLQELTGKIEGRSLPLDQQIWSIKRCAQYFDVTPEYFAQYIAAKPGFPQSAKIGHRKWIGQQVIDCALAHWDDLESRRKIRK